MTIRARQWVPALALALAGWIGTMAVVMVLTDAAPAAVVLFPADGFLARAPEAAVLGCGPFWLVLEAGKPGFGRALYRAGALLVLPAGLTGCLPLPARSS
jgi:hypothetical protein